MKLQLATLIPVPAPAEFQDSPITKPADCENQRLSMLRDHKL